MESSENGFGQWDRVNESMSQSICLTGKIVYEKRSQDNVQGASVKHSSSMRSKSQNNIKNISFSII